jgi:DNA repair protein RecO (recombination protein O)
MDKPRSIRVEAIVLRHRDWGEADRFLTLYTRELGKIKAIAKGARKVTSRKAGHLEPFTQVRLQLARGRSDLLIVTQADTVQAFTSLRDDLEQTGYASYVAELIDRFSYDEEGGNPAVFRLLSETLARIDDGSDTWLAVRYYEMRLLDFLGFRPQLFTCSNCEKEIKAEDQFFSAAQGGVLCPRCGTGLPGVREVSVEALKYLRHFQRSSYREAQRAHPTPAVQKEVEELMQYFLTFLLERALNSPEFLERIRKK